MRIERSWRRVRREEDWRKVKREKRELKVEEEVRGYGEEMGGRREVRRKGRR